MVDINSKLRVKFVMRTNEAGMDDLWKEIFKMRCLKIYFGVKLG